MHSVKRLLLLVVAPLLIAPAEGGCLGSCNCPSSGGGAYFSFPAELNVQLAATGAACRAPRCEQYGDAGGCVAYEVELTNTGSCQVTARAVDGREISADVTVVAQDLGCCGTRYVVDPTRPVSLTFGQDASMDTGG